jgi:type VI secretion system protein ImpF
VSARSELSVRESLQPSLLDRLTDDDPGNQRDTAEARVLSPEGLRECVRRDLASLMNCTHLAAVLDLSECPEVERSTLNYGVPDFTGRPASEIDRPGLARRIRRAIVEFEPRLMERSLKVKSIVDPGERRPNALRFEIEADMWSDPAPLRLRLRTDLSLEDGEARVTEALGG